MNLAFYAGFSAITFIAGIIGYGIYVVFPGISDGVLGFIVLAIYCVLFLGLLKAVGAKSVRYRGSNYEVSFDDAPEHRTKMEALKAQAQKADRAHQEILDALERYRRKDETLTSTTTNNPPKVPKDYKGPLI